MRKERRYCGAIIQRGPRIGQACGRPAWKDGICCNCRRKIKLSRVNSKYKEISDAGNLEHTHRKGIFTLNQGLKVRATEDHKRIQKKMLPLSSKILEENKSEIALNIGQEEQKISAAKPNLALTLIEKITEYENAINILLPKIQIMIKNQGILEENQMQVIDICKKAGIEFNKKKDAVAEDKNNEQTKQ